MRRKYFRYGSIFVLITCVFALLVSCGSSGGGDDGGPSTASITLNDPPEGGIPADGVSSFAIEAEVKDASGNPVAGGTSVTFSTTLGTFSNGSATYTEKTPDDAEGEPTGIVVVSLIAGTTPGVADVTVKCSGVTQSISITFTYAGPGGNMPVGEGFSLSAQCLNISGLWIAGLQDPIAAWVLDVNGNAVKDSTPIEFKTYNTGGLLDPYISATLNGVASSILTSTPDPTPQQGFVSVTAETTGGPTTRVTSLAVTPDPDNHIMYAGTNGGGVYKSTDSGAIWENISRSSENPKQGQNWIYPYIKGHSAICVDPDDHNTVYVGTGYLGKGNVYRTLDGGMNWNSNNVEEWNGMNIYRSLIGGEAAVLTVLCDGDDDPADYPYVWIGTEGRGILYAGDGENFQPSGGTVTTPVSGPGNTGNGTMSDPILSYTSKTETWTATCFVPEDASATVPVAGEDNQGDGYMSSVTTSLTTKTEDWTVTYKGAASNVTGPGGMTATDPVPGDANQGNGSMTLVTTSGTTRTEDWTVTRRIHEGPVAAKPGNEGDGLVENIVVKEAAATETWTLVCTNATVPETFSVTGSVSGAQADATVGVSYTTGSLDFEITAGGIAFVVGDTFYFETFNDWQVSGTVSGVQTNTATTGTPYTSDGGEVTFTINAGAMPFADGDTFTFSTGGKGTVGAIVVKGVVTETWTLTCIDASSQEFSVTGSVSGAQPNALVDYPYIDSDVIEFEINSGSVPFEVDDQITFDTTTYWQVSGTVSGAQTNTATTGTFYTSDGGEVGFTINERGVLFAIGDLFTFSTTGAFAPFWTVEGTVSGIQSGIAQNNTVYTSDNYEVSFTIYEGTIAFADGDTFTFSVTANTLSHGWTVWDIVKVPNTHGSTATLYAATATGVFKSVNGGQTWDETTSFTGDNISTLSLHPTSTGVIYAGTLNAGVWVSTNSGANWTQYHSGMEMGKSATIKDILVDPMNDRLYAITIQGTPDQAVGNVYTHALNADGSMATGQWSEANTGLAGVGLHVMAADDPLNPGALFAGGEGINLYKATGGGLTTGATAWQVSKSGLTNLIMARKPILFSGECGLNVSYWEYEGAYFFTVYVQDKNGNPPIEGYTFKVTWTDDWDKIIATFFDIAYGDCYTHQGTFSDPGNPFTNNPYMVFPFSPAPGDKLTIEFAPPEEPTDAGSSGAKQTLTYSF